jgi:uncharacterized protein (TIGR00251 family)
MRWLREDGDALVLALHVQPGARRTEVAGIHGDALKLRLAAPAMEGKANGALRAFLADAQARKLAHATFAGAIKLAGASDLTPAVLRAQVTSKGGTTERAVSVLDEHGVKASFVAAVKAAAARAKELGDEQHEAGG